MNAIDPMKRTPKGNAIRGVVAGSVVAAARSKSGSSKKTIARRALVGAGVGAGVGAALAPVNNAMVDHQDATRKATIRKRMAKRRKR